MIFKNKKGSLVDTIYVPIFILVIACTIFVGFYVWSAFSTGITPIVSTTAGNATILNAIADIQVGINSFDYIFPFIVGGLLLVSLIFAFKTGASVVYAFVSIIFWAFALMISVILTNIFGAFETTFPTVASSMPIITYTMDNMKWIVVFWGFILSIVMFTRSQKETQQLQSMEAFQ